MGVGFVKQIGFKQGVLYNSCCQFFLFVISSDIFVN